MKTLALALAALAVSSTPMVAKPSAPARLQVVHMSNPEFPRELTRRGILDGETSVVISLGPDGRVVDWLLLSYSHPAFEPLTRDILQSLECKPLNPDAPVRVNVRFQFETRGVIVSHEARETVDRLLTPFAGTRPVRKLSTPAQLDQPLVARRTVSPQFPAGAHAEERVTLEFLIDESGRVRIPVLHKGANVPLANAAADALAQWEFDPPIREGRPAIVIARQEFVLPAP